MKKVEQKKGERITVNEQNRGYIDRFVTENYKRLGAKYSSLDVTIDSSGFGAMDKLNDAIVSLYADPKLRFARWDAAERYMSSKFTDKAIRVVAKKPTRPEDENKEVEE